MNRKLTDKLATLIFTLFAAVIVLVLAALLSYVLYLGIQQVSWDFLTSKSSNFRAGGGIQDQLFNSFYILLWTMIFTIPLGLAGGIYMAEYAEDNKLTAIIRVCIETLASLPSIVLGMFGLLVFVNTFDIGYSVLSGALTLTIFNMPIMIRTCENAIRSVSPQQKEAGLALGYTHWRTITTVLLPSAFPSILTGIILSCGLVFGEAAALLYSAGMTTPNLDFGNWNPFAETSPLNIMRPAETLSVHVWKVNSEGIIPDIRDVADGGAAVLVTANLIFNISARLLGSWIHRKLTSK
ncbi:phosphate ABC transporter permease PstA [Natribacillus halophilus]|uniref:Phosphate transport system permease protein PstA n=1 Tax=Natribacillus halophilus TaxID=549003 RepID=A0A1G8RXQ7_9BACI|nr:phosphate ABC transporter permease PstA [Natribacillus halophilus]SDJ21749.1 phosphate ABC transporter membrane protein 2, PhoT family [Natribacillus halophilus]